MKEKQESNVIGNSLAESGEKKEVVVITVWYNRADHVEYSIKSILNQKFSNYSILAVDDGSTDETGESLEGMLRIADEREVPMRVWRKPNEGFVTTIKRAIEEKSNEQIIALHGAGDISLPNRLKAQYKLLKEEEDVIVSGVGYQKVTPEGEMVKEIIMPSEARVDLEMGKLPHPCTHGASMYYRSEYNKVGGYREPFIYAQDTDLWLRLGKVGKIKTVDQVLYKQILVDGSVSKADYETKLQQIFCSAAAVQSAKDRKEEMDDPIEQIDEEDLNSLKKVAKRDGIDERSVRRLCDLCSDCVYNRNIKGATRCVEELGLYGVIKLITITPNIVKKKLRRRLM